jgi:wyosine [tRNA(Phe)-imidazoG37] synthetase (radical SAM superfamily)
MSNKREAYFDVDAIMTEFIEWQKSGKAVDVITLVGEGEPTLYLNLGNLIRRLKALTDIPIAVITNGALLSEEAMRNELMEIDFVLPSFDAADEETFKRVNRPHGSIRYKAVYEGLVTFSKTYQGQLWIETMLVRDVNDTPEQLTSLKTALAAVEYDRLFINTPVRPPAESEVQEPVSETMTAAIELLDGMAINHLVSSGFFSDIPDDFDAVMSIIKRHPMNQFEIRSFLEDRECQNIDGVFQRLMVEKTVSVLDYKGYLTYRG